MWHTATTLPISNLEISFRSEPQGVELRNLEDNKRKSLHALVKVMVNKGSVQLEDYWFYVGSTPQASDYENATKLLSITSRKHLIKEVILPKRWEHDHHWSNNIGTYVYQYKWSHIEELWFMVSYHSNHTLGRGNWGKAMANDHFICSQVPFFMTTLCVRGWS